jgi:nucleoside-diphosphate-sugar epimerase
MKYSEGYWNDVAKARNSIPCVDELYGKSILITGATGMICSSVVDILLYMNRCENAKIRILAAGRNREKTEARFEGFSEADGLSFVPYDATQSIEIEIDENVDYFLHGASNANPAIYLKEPVETILANILGLKSVLDSARSKSAKRLLYVSSSEVYGQKNDSEPFFENDYGYLDILSQRAGYPSSKRAGESLCIAYGMEYGVDTVMVRPGHIYGPTIQDSDNRASAEFTRQAVSGKNIVMKSKGDQLRSYCYTLDCASAILAVLIKGENGNAYNISNPNSICTIKDIAEAIAKAAQITVEYDIPTEEEKKSYSPMNNSSLGSDKLEALGWKPMFPIDIGVRAMIRVLQK